MSKRVELDEAVFRLEMLTGTFVALEEAAEHSQIELPKHFLYLPVTELEKVCKKIALLISNQ